MHKKRRAFVFTAAVLTAIQLANATPVLTTIATSVGAFETETLAVDAAGDVYYGGSAVFELPAISRQNTLVAILKNGGAITSIASDTAGNLFVGTAYGGTYNDGVVAELSGPNHQTQTTLATFNTGTNDNNTTLLYSGGSLYGTTYPIDGTANPEIFRISGPAYNTFTSTGFIGTYNVGVVVDGSGDVFNYGIAPNPNSYESLFMLPANFSNDQAQKTVYTFNTSNQPVKPGCPLAMDAAGNIYATSGGGAYGYGCVFEILAPNYQTVKVLANLNSSTGSGSYGGLIVDNAGDLFGSSSTGGAYGQGDVFELSGPNDQTVSIVASYKSSDKTVPWNTLSVDGDGNLYGIAANYSSDFSDIFEITDSGFVVVPEPSCLSILALGAISLSRRRKRQ